MEARHKRLGVHAEGMGLAHVKVATRAAGNKCAGWDLLWERIEVDRFGTLFVEERIPTQLDRLAVANSLGLAGKLAGHIDSSGSVGNSVEDSSAAVDNSEAGHTPEASMLEWAGSLQTLDSLG